MWTLAGLVTLSLVFPAIWGWFAHWVSLRLWPAERRRTAPWRTEPAPEPAALFLDYQI
jgi:hypothetical protein